jgi:hypothetical protein
MRRFAGGGKAVPHVGWAKAAPRLRLMHDAGSAVPTRSNPICRETSRGHGAKERLCPPYEPSSNNDSERV